MNESSKNKRTASIKIRVTDSEKEALRKKSEYKNLAAWMRDFCLGAVDAKRRQANRPAPPVDPALIREVAKIGNNVNQLARAVNAGTLGEAHAVELLSQLAIIETALKDLREEFSR